MNSILPEKTGPAPNLDDLLRGEIAVLREWSAGWHRGHAAILLVTILIGSGLYGAAMGWWRAPLQAFYTAMKFPIVILITTLGNALLNAMLAPLLGVNLGLRQSILMVLMSFAIVSAVLGGLAPLLAFVVSNTPPFDIELGAALLAYRFTQLMVVAGIVYSGVVANVRLLPLLEVHAVSRRAARCVLLAWLAGNLFLGSQICWVLRPFIGRPQDAVEFLGREPFRGNFFETVFEAARALWLGHADREP